jgi:septal ring factor EnvC (AmiA/AmiB activator)
MNNEGVVTSVNPSCPKDVTAIDSIQWGAYPSSGTSMSPASLCGLAAAKEKDDRELKSIESQMKRIASQIVQSTRTLQSYNLDLLKQMGIDKKSLDDNLIKYKETNDHFSKYKTNYIKNTNGLVDDTQVMVDQESYSYMLWTMAAVTTVIVVLITMK